MIWFSFFSFLINQDLRVMKVCKYRFDDEYEINEKEMNYFLLLYQGDIECIIKIVCYKF